MKPFTPPNHKFIYNDCNVVMNPIIVWNGTPKKCNSDFYIKIGICVNGLWDVGYWYSNGASPVSTGRYSSEEEAVNKGIQDMEYLLTKDRCQFVKESDLNKVKASLQEFKNSLSTLVNDIDLSKVDLKGEMVQLSLF